MKFRPHIIFGITASAFAVFSVIEGCTPELSNPKPQPGTANFKRVVAIGGDFIAGYQDGALFADGQEKSIPALMARQFEFVGGGAFNQNLMANGAQGYGWNSKPWESLFVGASHLGYRVDCEGVESLGPVKDSLPWNIAVMCVNHNFVPNNNWGVPYAKTADLLNPLIGQSPNGYPNSFYYRMCSSPGSSTVTSDAAAVNPTFFTAWIGMEDIFEYARCGGEGTTIASSAQFSLHLDSILGALTANGAKGVIANIPDFREFPYYTLVPWNGAELSASTADSLTDYYSLTLPHIQFHEGNNGFMMADVNHPTGYRQIRRNEYITLSVPLDSMKCEYMGILFEVLPDRYVLDSTEVSFIDQMVAEYNSVIAIKAAQYGLAHVDMKNYFRSVNAGIKWDGVDFNETFVSGGFYSLDGYHPNQKGYALIANEFIYAINAKYSATIPPLNCFDCNGILFP